MNKEVRTSPPGDKGVRGWGRDGAFVVWYVLYGLSISCFVEASARGGHSTVLCVAWWPRHLLGGILIISSGSGRPGKFLSSSLPLSILLHPPLHFLSLSFLLSIFCGAGDKPGAALLLDKLLWLSHTAICLSLNLFRPRVSFVAALTL